MGELVCELRHESKEKVPDHNGAREALYELRDENKLWPPQEDRIIDPETISKAMQEIFGVKRR
jgi:hypothetical protein